jgi:peptidoglycan/xylan/chitin deacetylase (PgdA/CDA1 family)
VLNWAGFKAAVSFSFDDANQSQITDYPQLKALGVPFTFYLWGARIAMNNNLSTWTQIVKDGHEFANHTQTHRTVASFPSTNAAAQDVDTGQQTIQTDFPGVKVQTFAAPMGDTAYSPIAQTRYLLNRGANGQVGQACRITAGDETTHSPFNACGNVTTATPTTAAGLDADIDATRSGGTWYVLVVHGFTGANDGAYNPLALTDFEGGVNHAKMLGDVWIDTMVNVGSYWRGQNAFNKATVTGTAGSQQTWKWTLPANFPTGKFLRVTVTGGTLTQNGQTLAWSSHGYYEVSLDVGSLTLSP